MFFAFGQVCRNSSGNHISRQDVGCNFLQAQGVQSYLVSVPVDANHGFILDEPKHFFGVLLYMVSIPVEVSHGLTARESKFL